ncbi:STAS domain-containing protein [Streptomyces sp. NRRL F-5123]|uniref:STAS domain-containing protein n=1 Tax=Streptomyces sp. NRRL F-5123 TaxID=1463856 RepID=UPI00069430E4|nr:STAS domain-containing protein [Streptomyces sp. NRRL F-5123]
MRVARRTHPQPVIGGLILVVGGELIWGKRHDIMLVLRTSWMSSGAMILTFLATTQLPLQQAIVLGAVLSLLLYCVQAARQARLVALHRVPGSPGGPGRWETADPPAHLRPGTVTVLDYAGSSFFAELPRIEKQLPATDDARGAVLVLVVRALPDVPSSAMLKILDRCTARLAEQGGRLILCGVQPAFAQLLERSGLAGRLGRGGIVPATQELLGPLEAAYADASRWAGKRSSEQPPASG